MAAGNNAYDVILNLKGYILVEESYDKRSQQPFNARFSTGDPSQGDLSFWQFLKQQLWSGGAGQLVFDTTSKIQRSTGWSFLRGKPALCGGDSVVGAVSPTQILDEESSSIGWPYIAQILAFGKEAANAPAFILTGRKSDGTKDATLTSLRAASSSVAQIKQVMAEAAFTWHRSQFTSYGGTIMAYAYNDGATKVRFIDNAGNVLDTTSVTPLSAGTMVPRCGIAINDTYAFFLGPGEHNGAEGLVYLRLQYGAGNWTEASVYGSSSVAPEIPSPHACFDSNGTLYVCCISDVVSQNTELGGSALVLFTSADLLTANGPVLSSIQPYPDHLLAGAFSIGGTAYLIGVRKRKAGASTYFKPVVIKYPFTTIWESEYESTTLLDVMPRAFYQVSRNEVIFVNSKKDSGEAQSIMRLTLNDVVEEIAAISKDATGARVRAAAIFKQGTSIYVYDVANNNFRLVTIDPSDNLAVSSTRQLKLSRFGGNTDLINKTLYSITVELSEAITSGQTLTVKINGTTAGTIVNADGTRKEIVLSSEVTGSYFEPTFEMPSTATWPGTIEKVWLRFIPTQFKKRAWGFAIRATKRIKDATGLHETKTPIQMFDDLESAWESNVPIPFTDVDGQSYTVIVTDIRQKRPLLARSRLTDQESIAMIELLEV